MPSVYNWQEKIITNPKYFFFRENVHEMGQSVRFIYQFSTIPARVFPERIFLPILFLIWGITRASDASSAISATLVSVTEENVFLHKGQAVARISGLLLVNSEAASLAICLFF